MAARRARRRQVTQAFNQSSVFPGEVICGRLGFRRTVASRSNIRFSLILDMLRGRAGRQSLANIGHSDSAQGSLGACILAS